MSKFKIFEGVGERIEKKIFFKIATAIIFLVVFLSFVAVLTGTITLIMPTSSKSSEISVQKSEVDELTKPAPKVQTTTSATKKDENKTVTVEEETPEEKVAKSISAKLLASQDITKKDANYNSMLGEKTDAILDIFSKFGNQKLSGLQQLDEMSNSFEKAKFGEKTEAFCNIFAAKYDHQQQQIEQQEAASAANKRNALYAIGIGLGVFTIFVMILVMLRIEKNTRQLTNENSGYDKKDKIILVSLLIAGLLISTIIGWVSGAMFQGKDDFNATSFAKENIEANATEATTNDEMNATEANATEANIKDTTNYEANATEETDYTTYAAGLLGEDVANNVSKSTNSQGTTIYCNRGNSLCKTEQEVIDYKNAGGQSVGYGE